MVSFGSGSKKKTSTTSSLNFPTDFLNKATSYFGASPGYAPKYVGFNNPGDLDKLESNIYGSQSSKLTDAYNNAIARQRDELSQAGLLNSPSQYIEGGARDTLNKNYLMSLQQAARDASQARLATQEQEAGRETGFNTDTAKTLLQDWFNKLNLAGNTAGRSSSGTQTSGGGFNFGIGGKDIGALAGLFA